MDFHRVTATADPLYAPAMALYRASFPSHEQRQTASQEAILSHPDYHFLVLTEQGAPVGILLNWDTPHFRYIEHFAISPALRGRSFGSRSPPLVNSVSAFQRFGKPFRPALHT